MFDLSSPLLSPRLALDKESPQRPTEADPMTTLMLELDELTKQNSDLTLKNKDLSLQVGSLLQSKIDFDQKLMKEQQLRMDREFELDNYKSNFHDVNQRLKGVESQLQESENELFSLQTEYQNLKYSEAAKEDVLRQELGKQTNRLQEYK